MATVTMLEKARQGRRNAVASLATREQRSRNVPSIFDCAFDEAPTNAPTQGTNVIAFRSARQTPMLRPAAQRAA
ncbi:hypothetical protein [Maritimibacter sp. HL-12]|jgi:hypothetical protein|uniref:hypothetical protein n=1 Tax=Maritimibacter sp. HL-12 TaxID=1162418 RepID=UPI000A0EF7EA|nr:hypothetical protein [Maritimibacter sp. HL-12]SMH48076.1 hypothetical protein SAMN05661107_1947 [Maritimibacter sp. HL-12]